MESISQAKEPIKRKFIRWFNDSSISLAGAVFGGIGGFIYYKTTACASGSCLITSNPWLTVVWGSAMGYLIGSTLTQTKIAKMKKNMGLFDRLIRILIAVAVSVLYFTDVISGTLAIVLLIFSGIFILTSLIGSCPLYMPFGFSSKKKTA